MKYSKLVDIITKKAEDLYLDKAYSGGGRDGGRSLMYDRLEKFKHKLICEYDLRPSEYYKLSDLEIGEPIEFKNEIYQHKLTLINQIKL